MMTIAMDNKYLKYSILTNRACQAAEIMVLHDR